MNNLSDNEKILKQISEFIRNPANRAQAVRICKENGFDPDMLNQLGRVQGVHEAMKNIISKDDLLAGIKQICGNIPNDPHVIEMCRNITSSHNELMQLSGSNIPVSVTTLKKICSDNFERSDKEFASLQRMSIAEYLRILYKSGYKSVIKTCIDMCGMDFKEKAEKATRSVLTYFLPREMTSKESEARLTICLYTIAEASEKNQKLRQYIIDTGREKYKKWTEKIDRIRKYHTVDDNTGITADELLVLEREVDTKWPVKENSITTLTEDTAYLGMYSLLTKAKDDRYGTLAYCILYGENGYKLYDGSVDLKPFEKKHAILSLILRLSKDIDISMEKALDAIIYSRKLEYTIHLSISDDEGILERYFIKEADNELSRLKKTYHGLCSYFGTDLRWIFSSISSVSEALKKSSVLPMERIVEYALNDFILDKLKNAYSPSMNIETIQEVMDLLPEDEETIGAEISEFTSIITTSIFLYYISKLRTEAVILSKPEDTVKKDPRIEILERNLSEKEQENASMQKKINAITLRLDSIQSKKLSEDRIERHENRKTLMKHIERAEAEKERYRNLYEESREYIEALEQPEAPMQEIPDAETAVSEKLGGKRFMFISFDVEKSIPNVKKNFPTAVFCQTETDNMSGYHLDGIIVMTRHISHSIFYKLIKYRKEQYPDVPVLLFNQRNEKLLYTEMLKQFC